MILAAARRHGFSSRTAGEKEMVFRLTTIGERRELFRKMYLATAIRQLLLAICGRRQKRAGRLRPWGGTRIDLRALWPGICKTDGPADGGHSI